MARPRIRRRLSAVSALPFISGTLEGISSIEFLFFSLSMGLSSIYFTGGRWISSSSPSFVWQSIPRTKFSHQIWYQGSINSRMGSFQSTTGVASWYRSKTFCPTTAPWHRPNGRDSKSTNESRASPLTKLSALKNIY
jgi:hypothetical protein